jgi:TRAP-type C4-dicarboxylate transport system substrate-binding protein
MRRSLALFASAATLAVLALAPRDTSAQSPNELNIGSLAPNPSPWRTLLDRMESHIETATAGRINVILRPAGVMGEVEMVRETRKGERLQGAGATTAAIAQGGSIPVLQLVELPYLFDSYAQADHVLDTMFKQFGDLLYGRGFVLGAWSENGFRSYGTKGKPVRSPADLVGLKMRSQESEVHMATYKAFGATAIQQAMTEVRTSLQSGVIDGLDNSPVYILSAGLADPLDYFTLTQHTYQPAAIVFSRRWMDALPPADRASVLEVKKFAVEGRKLVRDETDEMIALLPGMGVQVVKLTPAEVDVFKAKARAMHASFAASQEGGAELLKQIQATRDAR